MADREAATAAPAHEVLGILGEQAHTVGTRVEQVLGTLGTVRGAAAETTARFDEGDVDVIGLVREQVRSQGCAAETGSDDRDTLLLAHAARVTDAR